MSCYSKYYKRRFSGRVYNTKEQKRSGGILFLAAARVNHILKSAGIRFFFVKGIFLSHILYEDINKRPGKDLDIFIHPSDAYRALRLLKKNGLRSGRLSFDTLKKFYLPFKMDFCLFEKGISIDLHFLLSDTGKRDICEYLRCEKYICINEINFPVPSDDYHLYFLIHHAKKHRFEYTGMFIDILEMYEMCKDTILLTEKEEGLVKRAFFNLKTDKTPLKEGSLKAYMRSFSCLSNKAKMRFIIKHLFLPMDEDEKFFCFTYFLYFIRPIVVLLKIIRLKNIIY